MGFFGIVSLKEKPPEVWSFPPVTLCIATCKSRGRNFSLKEETSVEFSKESTSWKIVFELMTGNVVMSKVHVDAPMHFVVVSKAAKRVPF